jgi:hypothetical protein
MGERGGTRPDPAQSPLNSVRSDAAQGLSRSSASRFSERDESRVMKSSSSLNRT